MMTDIQISTYRDFGKVLEHTLKYSVKNWKPLLTMYLVFAMPFYIIALGLTFFYFPILNNMIDSGIEELSEVPFEFSVFSILAGLASILANLAFSMGIFSYMKYDEQRQAGNIQEENWWRGTTQIMKQQSWPFIAVNLIYAFVFIVIIAIGVMLILATPVLGVIFFLALMVFMIYLGVVFQISLPTSIDAVGYSVRDVITKAFHLIRGKWWYTFGIIIVLGLIRGVIEGIISIPLVLIGLGKVITTGYPANLDDMTNNWYVWFSNAVSVLFYFIIVVGVALHYYSLREQKEGVSIQSRIDDFDEDDQEESNFSNEGSF